MALKQRITYELYPDLIRKALGITEEMQSLYIKIEALDQRNKDVNFRVDFFNREIEQTELDEIIYRINKVNIPSLYYSFIADEEEGALVLRKQAYEYLKTLPEFADCEDC